MDVVPGEDILHEPDEIAFGVTQKGLIIPTLDSLHRLLEAYGFESNGTLYNYNKRKFFGLYFDSQNNDVIVTYSWALVDCDLGFTKISMAALLVDPKILVRSAATGAIEEGNLTKYVDAYPKNYFGKAMIRIANNMLERQESVLKHIYR